jgi:hypothetical protein
MHDSVGIPMFVIALLPFVAGVRWVNRKDNRYFNYFVMVVLVLWGQALNIGVEPDVIGAQSMLFLAGAALGSFLALYLIHKHALKVDPESTPKEESLLAYVLRSFGQLTFVEKTSLAATILLLLSYIGNKYLNSISDMT